MPRVNVAVPFNFRGGGPVKHYPKGEQDLSAEAIAHADAHGFLTKPKADKPATKQDDPQ